MAQAERIGAGGERLDGALLDSHRPADRLHLERVGDRHAGEAELVAQHVSEQRATQSGGLVADLANTDVGGHDRRHAGVDGGPKREQRLRPQLIDGRQLEVRVLERVPVTGEVLGAGCDTASLEPLDEGGYMTGDELRIRAERPDADDRVVRRRVHVGDRSEVEVDAGGGEVGSHRAGNRAGQLHVVDDPERPVPGIRAALSRFETGDVATLLVDRDDELRPLGSESISQRA